MANRNVVYRREAMRVGEFDVIIEWKDVVRMTLRFSRRCECFRISAPLTASRKTVEDFACSCLPWMRKQIGKVSEKKERENSAAVQDLTEFRAMLERVIREREAAMGLHAERYVLRRMTSQWGSANPAKSTITVNTRLAAYPEECTVYLITHELAHFVHRGHQREFWELVERYFPDWRRVRKQLRD
ncbi:MAG TPA: hypothetical protein DC009_01570 [Porphyromonadaceae bacterium]|nr:hypothetical protein [Porphyromonadaceae bacterium]